MTECANSHPDHKCNRFDFCQDADHPENELHVVLNVYFPSGWRVASFPDIRYEEGQDRSQYIEDIRAALSGGVEAIVKQLEWREQTKKEFGKETSVWGEQGRLQ